MTCKSDPMRDYPDVKAMKRRAGEIKKLAPTIKHMHALELAAREKGYGSYASFRASLKSAEADRG
jgi:hypothetical protein